jgi:hypothetical protein
MREILVINPTRKAASSGRKGQIMPKRRRKRRVAAAPKRRRHYRRRNPSSPKRSYARRAASRLTSGLSIKAALKDQVPIQIGMLASQWAAKRWGTDASELDAASWNWASYAKGAGGAFLAGMAANMIKPGLGQKVLTGGLAHIVHRIVRNEIIEKSEWGTQQFGSGEQGEGIYVDEDGTPYSTSGGEFLPLDEQHRMLPSGSVMGDSVVPAGPLGYGQIEPVGPLGEGDFSRYARSYGR